MVVWQGSTAPVISGVPPGDSTARCPLNRGLRQQVGDGKIFVWPIKDAVRIRTGERGREAV